ncbi:MAG TPA: glycosyltransferase [Pyrinomonadaceae bacterium]|nr:glycosyltransferase [Pyrinomonadaceae bacterium]
MKHSDKLSSSGTIEISVVIPVRDEEDSVRALLKGLLSQTLPPAEIVITDSGSIDATKEIVEEFIRSGAPITLIREEAALPGRGRNVAVAHSRCDWIAFIDAGNTPAPNWLAHLAKKVGDGSVVDVVYGSYEPVVDSFFKECAAIAYVPPPVEIEGTLTRTRFIASALMRRHVWEAVGGFPEHLRSGEDLLFMQEIDQKGFQTIQAPQAVVYWSIQPTLWRTFKRFKNYARSNIRAGLWRQWQAAIFLRYALLALIALPAIIFGGFWLLAPLLFWFLLVLARAAKAIRENRRTFPAGIGRNVVRLFVLIPIIATLDAAAFVGSINWLLVDRLHLYGNAT